ncbi:PaaX family transcriptional regulator [Amycolatopsis alkalitolerans]|uniref:PaaX family transcriptional regulator n=1 Tax=Amycolatopsis alkalitolerans TaxID=2547244 RepID=A0A5C4M032_9PSEU|nr:PaaX family transcriptional regulator C-terminal domain-containing protein [Amycolatopsis alkalitolerans]TNC25770.1 PaaX family transcriptional regulator [Amycolatopsis alkalitolerans]
MSESLPTEDAGPVRGIQPRALIVTIYGLYAREVGGALSISSLIRLMATIGVDESAVRSSISRLKRRGLLLPEKVGGAAGYALSDRARAILDEGDRRIFERPRAGAGDGWLLAVFSVPESERDKRHQLRSRLSWLGFGTVASGVWIAPVHVEHEARDALASSGLSDYVSLFRAEYVAFRPEPEQVASWWDLDGLERMYEDFVEEYRPVLARWRRRRRDDDATAFADYVRVLTHWRRLPYLDPGLPAGLLPGNWRGSQAADVFFTLHERLAPDAHRYVEASTVTQPGRTA